MKHMKLPKGQLTARGLAIGLIGCVILTASSAYTALKLGALPWPIAFAAIISLFFLKLFGKTNLHEANVTHTIMSSGAMVAGGLAFTIPAAWMLGITEEMGFVEILATSVAGVLLGLVASAAIHYQSMKDERLSFPIGVSAAETLRASDTGGSSGKELFGSMALAGLWALLRDVFGIVPTFFAQISLPGLNFAIYNSPMLLSVGFLVGFVPVSFWFGGALAANLGLFVSQTFGLADLSFAQGVVSSLGMGMMMGAGVAVVLKDIVPMFVKNLAKRKNGEGALFSNLLIPGRIVATGAALSALILCLVLHISPAAAVVVCALTFITTIMSAQSAGQTGIDPMEIFALIVLLIVAALFSTPAAKLFFIAAVVAVASGLAGDVMNDFKAGDILGTDPLAQWIGQAIGALFGAVTAAFVIWALVSAFGADAFGPGKTFVAAQASVVATLIGGIPNVLAFDFGLVLAIVLYFAKLPAMLIGLGVYLPFYMSITAWLGALLAALWKHVFKGSDQTGLVLASGILGGESIAGVLVALWVLASNLFM